MKIFAIIIFILASVYLILPSPRFPSPPPKSIVSNEPADTESTYRRAYYSNLTRPELLSYYRQQFGPIPSLLLNYPPEESSSLIRDQTRSSWLQEFVHPLRESILISAFFPTRPADIIMIDGLQYSNKVIVRYLPSHPVTRITVLCLIYVSGYLLIKEYA